MRNETRALFNAYVSQIALLNGIDDATTRFSVDPAVEQRLEVKMRESSEFLSLINVTPVIDQTEQTLGLVTNRSLAGRTNTSGGTRRNPTDPTGEDETNTYFCRKTDFDWAMAYARLDAWRHRPEFETLLRDEILRQQARDRIQIVGPIMLADRLHRALQSVPVTTSSELRRPSAAGRDFVIESEPRATLESLILTLPAEQLTRQLIEEQRRADLLRAQGMQPRHRVLPRTRSTSGWWCGPTKPA